VKDLGVFKPKENNIRATSTYIDRGGCRQFRNFIYCRHTFNSQKHKTKFITAQQLVGDANPLPRRQCQNYWAYRDSVWN